MRRGYGKRRKMVSGINIAEIRRNVDASDAVVRVVIATHDGSTPRGAGASMIVTPTQQQGTIGGGALEYTAISTARALLKKQGEWLREYVKVPLGPSLGQCCGGAVNLLMERFSDLELAQLEGMENTFARPVISGAPINLPLPVQKTNTLGIVLKNGWLVEPISPPKQPLWIYGAGHVGRALVTTLVGLEFDVIWVDTARARFPGDIPDHAQMLIAANPADVVHHAPDHARHLVMTYSHKFDYDICHAVLARPFSTLGLIGSDTKRTRFLRRLKDAGVDASRLQCPIGERALGKEPMAIAVGVVAELLRPQQQGKHLMEVGA